MDATTFPVSFTYHLVFCVITCAFFILQFLRLRRPYQLILTVAIAGSLLIYVDKTNQTLFHAVGLFELVLLIGALVLSIVFRAKKKGGDVWSETPEDAVVTESAKENTEA